jgi:hypothetical protein
VRRVDDIKKVNKKILIKASTSIYGKGKGESCVMIAVISVLSRDLTNIINCGKYITIDQGVSGRRVAEKRPLPLKAPASIQNYLALSRWQVMQLFKSYKFYPISESFHVSCN